MKYAGYHVGFVEDIIKVLEKEPVNIIQIMLTKGNHKGITKRSDEELEEIKRWREENHKKIVVHCSYMINLSRKLNPHSWWIKNFIDEVEYAYKMGAVGAIIHFGKHLDLSIEEAMENMRKVLKYVLKRTPQKSKIILETPSGQGTEICWKIDDLIKFMKSMNKRVKLCVDTCHIHVAGYDVMYYLKRVHKAVGIKIVHLNNAKYEKGSRRDVHANIYEGTISKKTMDEAIKFCLDNGIKIVAETPDVRKLKR